MRRLLDQEKLELAKYVRQAKGSLSLNAFSQKTGVSKYQLSRIMNGKFKDQPRESTILAIANGSEHSSIRNILKITYLSEEVYNQEIEKEKSLNCKSNSPKLQTEEHTHDSTVISDPINDPVFSENAAFPKKKRYRRFTTLDPLSTLLKSLLGLPVEWTKTLDTCPIDLFVENYICIRFAEDCPLKKWHFIFLEKHPYEYPTYLITVLGALYNHSMPLTEKFSIIVDCQRNFEYAKFAKREFPPSFVSIIGIDVENILHEFYYPIHPDIAENTLKIFTLSNI